MKMIIAVIQPEKLDDVKQALFDANVHKMTVSRVKGCGQQRGYRESYRGQVHSVNLLDKIRIEIAVSDEFVEPTLQVIVTAAKTHSIGDGKIFVMPMDECIRIRTDERGAAAIG
jgi:nitrogen regulatory protein P-II 2